MEEATSNFASSAEIELRVSETVTSKLECLRLTLPIPNQGGTMAQSLARAAKGSSKDPSESSWAISAEGP